LIRYKKHDSKKEKNVVDTIKNFSTGKFWHIPVIPESERWRQEDLELKASPGKFSDFMPKNKIKTKRIFGHGSSDRALV
jgi:hypothetical protein